MLRILLAEDDQVMREYLTRALERSGYAVTAVDRGTAAIPLLEEAHVVQETNAIHTVFRAKRDRLLAGLQKLGVRVVTERTGIVLGAGGGALAKMLTPFKLGAGGPLGNGRQWMPWVHVSDLARLYLHAAEHESIRGPMNAVAPHPVRNSEFTKALGRQLRRPAFMPAPYLGLRLLFGEFAQVLFASQRVVPQVALDTGFTFQYPDIAAALKEILAPAA
jgi:uncharacterized protein (TIGR01777 family)